MQDMGVWHDGREKYHYTQILLEKSAEFLPFHFVVFNVFGRRAICVV